MSRRARAAALLAFGALALVAPAEAQRRGTEESRMLREAAARESRGDLEGAEGVLRRLLRQSPGSSGGLFALERVLRAMGRTQAILPAVDSFLVHEPTSAGVRYLKLRVLLESDSLDALEREAERWFSLQPEDDVPYREVARVYERAFGPERALDVLRRGRSATGRERALALEIGDLLVAAGSLDEAVGEWAVAVMDDSEQAPVIARRIAGLAARQRDGAGRQLVSRLGEAEDPGAREAGARIALDLRMGPEALELSRSAAERLEGRPRNGFLSDVARRAQEADLVEVAAWAYRELGADAADGVERRRFDERIVEVSLASGDTTAALEAQRRVAESYPRGSLDRRRAAAQVIRLQGSSADPAHLKAMLAEFRGEFPQAPELDDLAATVAAGLLARGDPEGAASVLEGIDGPRSSLERGYLLLETGQVEDGRQALLSSLPGLTPTDATEVIQLVTLFDRVSPEGGEILARAAVRAHRGDAEGAAALLAEGARTLGGDERAPLIAQAARVSERGGALALAAGLREGLLADFPEAPEAAEAALELARFRARTPDGVDGAIRILEALITERPNAAIVPDARRELERLRRRGS